MTIYGNSTSYVERNLFPTTIPESNVCFYGCQNTKLVQGSCVTIHALNEILKLSIKTHGKTIETT